MKAKIVNILIKWGKRRKTTNLEDQNTVQTYNIKNQKKTTNLEDQNTVQTYNIKNTFQFGES